MNLDDLIGAFMGLVLFCIPAGLALGWVMNLVAFCSADFEAPYKNEAIRGVSIFVAPIGGIVGWIDIDDTPKAELETE